MKHTFFVRASLLVVAINAATIHSVFAETEKLIKEQPHAIYHVVKNKTLQEASNQIALRSGIAFQLNAANKNDSITAKLAAENWQAALAQFLRGYNYTTASANGKIKSVIVTGLNGSGTTNPDAMVAIAPDVVDSLPDQYKNHAPGSVEPINLNMDKLTQTPVGKKVTLDLPIGQYTVAHDDYVKHNDGSSTWIGYLDEEGKAYRVYLSQGDAGLMGNVNTPDGMYTIDTVAGQTYWVDVNRSGQLAGGFHNDQVSEPLANAGFDIKTAAALASNGASALKVKTPRSVVATVPVVDIMVLYTIVKQTAAFARQRLQYLTDVTNKAYKDSKINIQLRLVHTRATKYSETAPHDVALSDLSRDRGALAGTSALRTKYGADLVFLFRPYYRSTHGSCGMTYVGFSSGQSGNPGTAFGTVSDGTSHDNYNLYYCGLQTFAHETGHSLGNVHDRYYASFQGKFPYSYAWGIYGKFGTIMSYYSPSLMFYSTPLLKTQCKGGPCGYAEGNVNSSDQSRTINYTGPIVAGFKPKTTAVPVIQ